MYSDYLSKACFSFFPQTVNALSSLKLLPLVPATAYKDEVHNIQSHCTAPNPIVSCSLNPHQCLLFFFFFGCFLSLCHLLHFPDTSNSSLSQKHHSFTPIFLSQFQFLLPRLWSALKNSCTSFVTQLECHIL